MTLENTEHKNIFILSGAIHSGKSTALSKIVEMLKGKNLVVSGFIARGTFKNKVRDRFDLINIDSNQALPLASVSKTEGWLRFRNFYFNPKAFETGEMIIMNAFKNKADVIVIDEVGPMELEGNGWYKVLNLLQSDLTTIQLWVVREQILNAVCQHWSIPSGNIYELNSGSVDLLTERIIANHSARRAPL